MSSRRGAYKELRGPIEERGGSMVHVKQGYQGGAWIVSLDGKKRTFLSNGRGYPELDRLYVPKVEHPTHYRDYSYKLVAGAVERLIAMLR